MKKSTIKYTPLTLPAEMVRAVRDGRKTQHRVVMNPQPTKIARDFIRVVPGGDAIAAEGFVWALPKSPYKVGDRIWVRETWAVSSAYDSYRSGVLSIHTGDVEYAAGGGFMFEIREEVGCWRSPATMPRWASRFTLEIKSVRMERLQAISEADAIAEGVERLNLSSGIVAGARVHPMTSTHAEAYHALFGSIYGHHLVTANPWTFVLGLGMVDGGAA